MRHLHQPREAHHQHASACILQGAFNGYSTRCRTRRLLQSGSRPAVPTLFDPHLTLVRTIVLLRAYVNFADQQGRAPSACVTVSVGLTLSYLLLFLTFVVFPAVLVR